MVLASEHFSDVSERARLKKIWHQSVNVVGSNLKIKQVPLFLAAFKDAPEFPDVSKILIPEDSPFLKHSLQESMELYATYLESETHQAFVDTTGINLGYKKLGNQLPRFILDKECPICGNPLVFKFNTRSNHKTSYGDWYYCSSCSFRENEDGWHPYGCSCPKCHEDVSDKSSPTKNGSKATAEAFSQLMEVVSSLDTDRTEFTFDNAVQTLLRDNNQLKIRVATFESRINLIQGLLVDRLPIKESLILSDFLEGKINEQVVMDSLNIKPL